MIKLDVENYCHNCPDFEAEVSKNAMYYDGSPETFFCIGDTIVRCENRHLCERLKKRLEEKKYDL